MICIEDTSKLTEEERSSTVDIPVIRSAEDTSYWDYYMLYSSRIGETRSKARLLEYYESREFPIGPTCLGVWRE